jgi:hypothetical protein
MLRDLDLPLSVVAETRVVKRHYVRRIPRPSHRRRENDRRAHAAFAEIEEAFV